MELPVKINICPIVDAVMEIRFNAKVHSNAIFGMIYSNLRHDYQDVEKLPILQLPEQLRDSDSTFKFKPQYKIKSESGYTVQIGPNVVIIGSEIPYSGWNNFKEKISEILKSIFNSDMGIVVNRLGLRYINFFELDALERINLEISVNSPLKLESPTIIRTSVPLNGYSNNLQLANGVERLVKDNSLNGSIIDIDTYKEYVDTSFENDYMSEIERAHSVEKELFFSLLKPEFLQELKPEYD
ncbi:MAG: TIGR04255 family protein [Bacteroidetes bacterium]|nr:TIGR04255 family protein [Bacteroidota bacterium]